MATTVKKAVSRVRGSPSSGRAWAGLAVPFLLALIGGAPSSRAEAQAPTVQRFNFRGLAAGDSTYYRDEVVRVRVLFTQHVTVDTSGGEPYLDLTIGSTTRRANFGSSRQNYLDFRYRVQADDFDGDGVSVPANGVKLNGATITAKDDTSANANVAHDSAAGGPSRKVDGSKHRPPEVRNVTFSNSPASGDTYGYGEKIEATAAFSHRVLATTTGGTPSLALTIGAHTRQAALTRAGRRTRLTFSYTVQAGDLAPAGASIAANAVRLNGGTITHDTDTATHAALAHGAVAADSTRKVNGRQGRPPKVEGVAFAAPAPKDSVYWRGDTIAVRVGFDDSVAVNTTGGSPQVALTIGTATRQATFSANNGKTLVFEYVVQSGDRDADGVSIAANALALNGATIRGTGAASARDADVTHPLVEASTARTVDGSKGRAPSIRSVAFAGSAPEGGTYHYDAEVRVEVVFDRSVAVDTVRGSPRLALAVGARRRHAAFAASASTGTTLVFAYRVQSADMDSDGASIDANALELNGGKIKAEADSTAAANLTHDVLAADLTRKVDGRPRITGLEFYHVGPPPPRGVYGYQERIWVLAHFDQKLELERRVHLSIEVGTDTVRLRSRAQLRMADSAVAFYYIVTRDAVDTDGVRIPKGALTLSGGSLRAASDGATNARLNHDEVPADSSWRVNGRLTPVPRPFVHFRGLPTNGNTYTRHERISIGVSYTVGVVVTGTPELTLNLGMGTRQLAAVGATSRGPVFEYVVQTGDVDEDGVGVSANALSWPNGATIRSAADTSVLASLTHDSVPASAVHKVNGRRVEAARVQWVSINPPPSRDSTYTRSETFYVNTTFDRGVAVDTTGGRPRIALEIGDSTRYATYSHAYNQRPRYQVFMYVVQAGDRDADGFSIAANAMELNGGAITAPDDTVRADLSHGAVRPGAAYKVDGDRSGAPHVRWMWFHAPASGDTFLRNDRVVLTVAFDRATAVDTVGGRPRIALQVGDSTRHATYLGPPGTWTSFKFGYVVQAGDRDADGLSIPANALELNGGKITAPGDTTAAVLTHDSLPTSPSHKVDGDRARAARLLRVGISPPPSSDSTYTRGEILDVNAYFDRDVAVDMTGGRPRIALEIGDSTRYATYSHAYSGTWSLQVFKYVVQAGDQDADGLSIAANALELNGGAITAPNDTVRAELSHGAVRPGAASKVDGNRSGAPHVRWMWFHGPASGDTYVRGERVVVTLAFDRATAVDTVGGRPRLALQVGDSTRYAYSNRAFGRPWQLVLEYVVQASDRDADGLSIAANALELNGAVITAPGDTTAAVLTHDSLPANAAHKVDGSRVRAARLLRMEISRPPSRDSTYTRGERLYVSASFDRDVAVDATGGRPRITLEIGDSTRYATYSYAYGGPSFHLFTYVVQAGDRDADGVSIAANALELNGGAITAVGDTLRAELSSDAVAAGGAYKVDGNRSSAPHVRAMWFVAPASGDTFLRGERVAVRMEFDRATAVDTVGGQPRLALQVGDSTRHAYLNPAYGQPWQMEFDYVVQAGDRDADGLSIAANALSANGSTITMPGSTTAAVLTHDSVPTSPSHKVDGSRTAGDAAPEENRAPEVVSAIAPKSMEVASPVVVVDLSAHFRDPDGDELRYFAVSASSRLVRADVAGSTLTIAALAMGESLVTVRAADPDGAEAEHNFMVTVETSRADRARVLKRSLAAFGRAVGTEAVEAIGSRLGAADDRPDAAAGEAHLQVGGRSLSCVGAGERCGLEELARQAAGVLGLRMSQGAGSLASALWAAAKGSHDSGALRGLAGVFGRPGQIGSTAGLGSAAGHGDGGFGATTGGAAGPNASFTGRHGDRPGWGRLVSVDPVSREELLARSSFRFSPGAGQPATPSGWTFWGQASAAGFEGRPEDDLALDGTVRSAYLGADYRFGAGPLVGLALSRTTSSIGFESGINGTGTVDARLTSLYPYAQWSPRAGLSIWGLVGAGRGTAELSEDATHREFATNIGMAMTAAGVRQRLTGVLAVKADAFAVRTDAEEARELAGVVANVQRLRLASEIGGRWGLAGGSAITSRVELGARFDGGDAETGAGAEVGAGIGYVDDGIGLSVDARGRALVAHQASSLREWGASVAVRLQPSREAGGLSLTLEPTWGNAASGMAMLWRDGPTGGAAGAATGASSAWQAEGAPLTDGRASPTAGRLQMELDYAIVLADGGRVAPFGRWAAERGSARRLNVGVRLSVLEAATLDLFGEQVSGRAEPADRRLGLQGALRFR